MLGPDAVRFGWVKTHVGTHGSEKADQLAKEGAVSSERWIGVRRMVAEGEPGGS